MSTTLLLRMIRRLTSLSLRTPEELMEAELLNSNGQPDIDLSVFEADDARELVVRVRTEFHASYKNPPNEEQGSVSLHGMDGVEVGVSRGTTSFSFTQGCHRSLRLLDGDEVREVAATMLKEAQARSRTVDVESMRGYARRRLEDEDPEWIELCKNKNKRRWRNWAFEPHQSPPPPPPPPPEPKPTMPEEQLDGERSVVVSGEQQSRKSQRLSDGSDENRAGEKMPPDDTDKASSA